MELQKIYTDSDFSNAVIPEGSILTYLAQDEDGNIVTKTKNSSGEIGVIAGGESGESVIPGYFINNANGTLSFQPIGGTAETVSQVSIVNTGVAEPDYSAAVVGTDTSDATATVEDIAEGKTAYTATGKVTGTATFSGGMDFYKCASVDTGEPILQTPNDATSNNGSDYTISASSYYGSGYDPYRAFAGLDGEDQGWFSGQGISSAYLQIQFTEPKSVNRLYLKSAYDSNNQVLTAFSLQGSNDGESWTVIYEVTSDPAVLEAGFDFDTVSYTHYRVNMSNGGFNYIGLQKFELYYKNESSKKTWTGYLAVLTGGVYTFEETATTGLTYGVAYTPKQDGIYNADATIQVTKLWDGGLIPSDCLVGYWSLGEITNDMVLAPTSGLSQPDFGVNKNGIVSMCAADAYKTIKINLSDILSIFTLSIWFYPITTDRSGYVVAFGNEVGITSNSSNNLGINHKETTTLTTTDKWNHVAMTFNSGNAVLYWNGEKTSEVSGLNTPTVAAIGVAGKATDHTSDRIAGYFAHLRVYSKILTVDEIEKLANEFTPTA